MKLTHILILIVAFSATLQVYADTRTTRKKLKRITEISDTARNDGADSCTVCDSLIFSNYDKPLRSTKETFFIDNRSSGTVKSITVLLVYQHSDGTMLHSREVTVSCDIPPGERRLLSTPSWDVQLAYYYIYTRITPRSKKAKPFKVIAVVTHAVLTDAEVPVS